MIYGIFVPPWLHMRCYDASKRRTAARTETRGVARCRSVALASGAGADEIVERALWEVNYDLRFTLYFQKQYCQSRESTCNT
jgi:hypothetical protein